MPNANFLDELRKEKKSAGVTPGFPVNSSVYRGKAPTGDVGLELEIEGNGLPRTGDIANVNTRDVCWSSIGDGSLRNGGREYVLTRPIKTSEIREMVGGLFKRFKDLGTRINNTNRCSTHVHVNVGGLKVNQITSAIALWCSFQGAFIRWCGEERTSNHFCLSTRDEEGMLEAWDGFLKRGAIPQKNNIKYTALNILPIWAQGSLEFRCGGRPDEPDKIVYWAKICNSIVKYAAENFANPNELSYAMSERGPKEILQSLLEHAKLGPLNTERIYEELTQDPAFERTCMEDFRDVQEIIHSYPWDNLMEEINREYVENPFTKDRKKKNLREEAPIPAAGRVRPRYNIEIDDDW